MDEHLMALSIEDIEKSGKRADKGFHSATLKAAVVVVSTKCEKNVTSKNVRSKIKTLRRDFFTMKATLETSRFGITWDDGAKYNTADPGSWDEYVKSHPDAKGLRHKFLPHHDSLAIICGVDNATGDGMITGQDPEALQENGRVDEGENDAKDLGSEHVINGVSMDGGSPTMPM